MSQTPTGSGEPVGMLGLLVVLCVVLGVLHVRYPTRMAYGKSMFDPPESAGRGDGFRQLFGIVMVGIGTVLAVTLLQQFVTVAPPAPAGAGVVLLGAGVVAKRDADDARDKLTVVLSLVVGTGLLVSAVVVL